MNWSAYCRLARLHKPSGTLLLWSPTAWALWIANAGNPPLLLVILFLLGTILMRAAGCVMNDIADRQIDLHVKRTKTRPLTAGEVTLSEAIILLLTLLFCALLILLQLPMACYIWALIAVLVTVAYPFCKRYIQCPQLVLGIAFSLGIPMAFAASNALQNNSMLYLLLINFLWIIAYDTEYAMADRADDLRIGVKSSAILFADYDRLVIAFLQISFHSLWLLLAFNLGFSSGFYALWLVSLSILIYQHFLLLDRNEEKCMRAFSSNSWYGLIIWIGVVLDALQII